MLHPGERGPVSDTFSRICDHPCCITNHVTCECPLFCECDHGIAPEYSHPEGDEE
jgi:hypothetical protein